MNDFNFYLVNDYCACCNAVTPHEAFEVQHDSPSRNQNSTAVIEHHCEQCQQRNN